MTSVKDIQMNPGLGEVPAFSIPILSDPAVLLTAPPTELSMGAETLPVRKLFHPKNLRKTFHLAGPYSTGLVIIDDMALLHVLLEDVIDQLDSTPEGVPSDPA